MTDIYLRKKEETPSRIWEIREIRSNAEFFRTLISDASCIPVRLNNTAITYASKSKSYNFNVSIKKKLPTLLPESYSRLVSFYFT